MRQTVYFADYDETGLIEETVSVEDEDEGTIMHIVKKVKNG